MQSSDVLIVYGSRHGQTEKVARRVAARLAERGLSASLVRCPELPAALRPADFAAVVVASPVHFGRHDRCIEGFAREHADTLASRPSLFLSVCGAAMGESAEEREEAAGYLADFARRTGWRAGRAASVAGALAFTRYGFLVRWIMKRISARRGLDTDTSRDHEYTDWEALDRLADELAVCIWPIPVQDAPLPTAVRPVGVPGA